MKKVFLTVLAAMALVISISSCRNDLDTSQEDLEAIDNDEIKEEDI